jgi:hypothetical protein
MVMGPVALKFPAGIFPCRMAVRSIHGVTAVGWMARLTVQDNRAKVELGNDNGSGIPTIKAGQVIQIKSGQGVLAESK